MPCMREVSVDQAEISEGTLSLLLKIVDFMDEAISKYCTTWMKWKYS